MQLANFGADDGATETRLIHPGQSGWFALMRRLPNGTWMSRCHPLSVVEEAAQAVRNQADIYISQASFTAPKRRLTYLSRIRAAWVDLDCYNLGAEPSQEFVSEVVARAVAAGLPAPTYVVRSGRGLYAKWIFEREIDAANLPVWSGLQATLVAAFRALGADPRAKDAARVLRPLGSINSKAPQAEPVHAAWTSGCLVDFDTLCQRAVAVRPEMETNGRLSTQDQTSRLKELRKQASELATLTESISHLEELDAYALTREPILLGEHGARALNWRRFLDLRKLAHMRSGVHRGSRDSFVFWMMTFLCHAQVVNSANFWHELQCLSKFVQSDDYRPMSDGSMGTLFDRLKSSTPQQGNARGDQIYTATNNRLIELLEITPREQENLTTIISREEKRRRADQRAPGRAEHRERLTHSQATAMDCLDRGVPIQEIAARTGVHRRQIYRWQQARRLGQENPQSVLASGRARSVHRADISEQVLRTVRDALSRKSSHRQIRESLGLSESAMRSVMRQLGKTSDCLSSLAPAKATRADEGGHSSDCPKSLGPEAMRLPMPIHGRWLESRVVINRCSSTHHCPTRANAALIAAASCESVRELRRDRTVSDSPWESDWVGAPGEGIDRSLFKSRSNLAHAMTATSSGFDVDGSKTDECARRPLRIDRLVAAPTEHVEAGAGGTLAQADAKQHHRWKHPTRRGSSTEGKHSWIAGRKPTRSHSRPTHIDRRDRTGYRGSG